MSASLPHDHPPHAASLADAAQLFDDSALTRRFAPVFARIAQGAVHRERHRELATQVGRVIAQMDASGELARLRDSLVKQYLNEQ